MSVSAYMKVIADNLRKAATQRQKEISDLRSEISIQESQMKSRIGQLESQIIQHRTDLIEHSDVTSTVVANTALVDRLRQEIKDAEREFNEFKATREQNISAKERDISSLNQEAGSFENRAARG